MLIGVSGDRNRRVLPKGVKAWRMDGHEITQNAEGEERPDSRVLCFSCPVSSPPWTNDTPPVSSETTTTSASVSSVIPIAALCLMP